MSHVVVLNVGGTLFSTTHNTLLVDESSMLAAMFDEKRGHKLLQMKDGSFFIDRDPIYFRPILNFLRTNRVHIDRNISCSGVLEEAKFFNVIPMQLALLMEYRSGNIDAHDLSKDQLEELYQIYNAQKQEEVKLRELVAPASKVASSKQYVEPNDSRAELSRKELIQIIAGNSMDARLRLSGICFARQDLSGLDMGNCNLNSSNFSYCNLERVVFYSSTLSKCCFKNANLQYTNCMEANLVGADFRYADLRRVRFQEADLMASNFEHAIFDDSTQWNGASLRNVTGLTAEQKAQIKQKVATSLREKVPNMTNKGATFPNPGLGGCTRCSIHAHYKTVQQWKRVQQVPFLGDEQDLQNQCQDNSFQMIKLGINGRHQHIKVNFLFAFWSLYLGMSGFLERILCCFTPAEPTARIENQHVQPNYLSTCKSPSSHLKLQPSVVKKEFGQTTQPIKEDSFGSPSDKIAFAHDFDTRCLCIELGAAGISMALVTGSQSEVVPLLSGFKRIPAAINTKSGKIGKFAFSGKPQSWKFNFLESFCDGQDVSEDLIAFLNSCVANIENIESTVLLSLPPSKDWAALQNTLHEYFSSASGGSITFIHSTHGTLVSFMERNKILLDSACKVMVVQFGGGFLSYESYELAGDTITSTKFGTSRVGSSTMIHWCMKNIYKQLGGQGELDNESFEYYPVLYQEINEIIPLFDDIDNEAVDFEIFNQKIMDSFPGLPQRVEEEEEEEEMLSLSIKDYSNFLKFSLEHSQTFQDIRSSIHKEGYECVILQGGMSKSPIFRQLLTGQSSNVKLVESFDMFHSCLEGLSHIAGTPEFTIMKK